MSLPPFNGMASEPAQCLLLASLVICQRPGIAVEAGTYQGHTAFHIANALKTNGIGHLHTADHALFGQRDVLAGLEQWVTFYQSDYLDMLAKIPRVDFAYIDSGDAEVRLEHFEATRAKLRSGGIICVDDTLGGDPPMERIRELCGLNFRFLRGLSVCVAP